MPIKVLWAEEEPNSFRYEVYLTRKYGWEITWALNLSDAIDLIRDMKFDLVVVDCIFPQDDFAQDLGYVDINAGMKLIETIQDPERIGLTPHRVPMIVITAIVTPMYREAIINKIGSPNYYLNKPLEEKKFINTIENITHKISDSVNST